MSKTFEVTINIRGRSLFRLKDYLFSHEEEIYYGIDAFADLHPLFVDILEREPVGTEDEII